MNQDQARVDIIASPSIVDVSLIPWYRAGLLGRIPGYKIVSLGSYGINNNDVITLNSYGDVSLSKMNSAQMMQLESFKEAVSTNGLEHAKFLTHKPRPMSYENALAEGNHFSKYENKRIARELFSDTLNFADYKIYRADELPSLEDLHRHFSGGVVLQHESMSGGKGTVLSTPQDKSQVELSALLGKTKPDEHIIVSKLLAGYQEISQQVFVGSKSGIVKGPLQSQFVRNTVLAPVKGGDQFCGGTISSSLINDEALQANIDSQVDIVVSRLRQDGYKGIVGVDLIVNEARGEVVFIEINPRITGMLPLVNFSNMPVGIHELRTLELVGANYTYKKGTNNPLRPECSYYVIHADNKDPMRVSNYMQSQTLHYDGTQAAEAPETFPDNRIIYTSFVEEGQRLPVGGRIGGVLIDRSLQPGSDEFYELIVPVVLRARDTLEVF